MPVFLMMSNRPWPAESDRPQDCGGEHHVFFAPREALAERLLRVIVFECTPDLPAGMFFQIAEVGYNDDILLSCSRSVDRYHPDLDLRPFYDVHPREHDELLDVFARAANRIEDELLYSSPDYDDRLFRISLDVEQSLLWDGQHHVRKFSAPICFIRGWKVAWFVKTFLSEVIEVEDGEFVVDRAPLAGELVTVAIPGIEVQFDQQIDISLKTAHRALKLNPTDMKQPGALVPSTLKRDDIPVSGSEGDDRLLHIAPTMAGLEYLESRRCLPVKVAIIDHPIASRSDETLVGGEHGQRPTNSIPSNLPVEVSMATNGDHGQITVGGKVYRITSSQFAAAKSLWDMNEKPLTDGQLIRRTLKMNGEPGNAGAPTQIKKIVKAHPDLRAVFMLPSGHATGFRLLRKTP